MSWYDAIILLAELVGAVTVIIVAITKITKPIKAMQKDVAETKAKVASLGGHEEENYMSLLRLTVMSSDMPLSERILAGRKYIEGGGNGDVKKWVLSVDREYKEEHPTG